MKNVDKKTVQDFGEEWEKFNQSEISDDVVFSENTPYWVCISRKS